MIHFGPTLTERGSTVIYFHFIKMSSCISGVPLTSVPPPGVVPPGYERKFLYVQIGMENRHLNYSKKNYAENNFLNFRRYFKYV
jgi:hypothetical protein